MSGNGLKASAYASLSLAFASFGDAFLYPFLPINNVAVGIPIVWVGVLLSINRFVRILSNGLMVQLFSRYGLRTIMILAVTLAIFSTAGYAMASGVLTWVLFRVCWGLSFSAMRIGTLGYALQGAKQGTALGISRGLQEAGPMLALFLTPLLLDGLNTGMTFVILSTMSIPALYFAVMLPRGEDRTASTASMTFLKFPSTFNSITLVTAIIIDGIIVVVLGVLFIHYRESITPLVATSLAAFYLGFRRVCLVILSPASGWVADRIGFARVFSTSMTMIIVGLVVLASGWVATGAIIIFSFYSIQSAITPGSVSQGQSHSLAAVAENATWRDIGAAVGTLLGGILIASPFLIQTLLIATFGIVVLFLFHLGTIQRALKILYAWK